MKLCEIIRYLEESRANPCLHSARQDELEVKDVHSDSRKVSSGSIFCCIRGEKSDGHDFALSAQAAGAVALLAERYIPECVIPQIIVNSTREWMGKVAAKVYGEPSKKLKMYAVTGTNGKTTTTWVIRSLLESMGIKCGLIGTILQNDGLFDYEAARTTPESCDLHRLLFNMVRNGCKACVMETSSIGLDMGRLDGCEFDVMVFNNLNPEHLDYHHDSMEEYFIAKCLLFDKYSKKDGVIVANADDSYGKRVIDKYGDLFKIRAFAMDTLSADFSAHELKLGINGSEFKLFVSGKYISTFCTPLVAAFNVRNTLGALSAVYNDGIDIELLVKGVTATPQVPGRLEKYFIPIGDNARAACCIIDFAHTPEALKNVLNAVRDFCDSKLISVFGHGGERYQGSRPALGSVAATIADRLIITMDNPRSESPQYIADQIAAGARDANPLMDMKTIIDRKKAIKTALDEVKEGDVVVITGKGPEKYLIIGDKYFKYSDTEQVLLWLKYKSFPSPSKLILDSREVKAAAAASECGFVALVGKNTDGHLFIEQALKDGAKFIVGKSDGKPENFPDNIPYIVLDDTERDLAHIAKKYIEESFQNNLKEVIAITGSVGKTTTREAVKMVLEKKYRVHAAARSYNTLIGCAVSILSMPADTEVLILEFGANKPGEIRELAEFFGPTISVITEVAPVHLDGFKTIDGVLSGKMEITCSENLKTFIYNADNHLLHSSAEEIRDKCSVLSIGRSQTADYRIKDISEKCSLPIKWELIHKGRPQIMVAEFWGRHPILALSIAAAIGRELGVDEGIICGAISEYKPLIGRGRIVYGKTGKIVVDDAYNANPASMLASVSSLLDIEVNGNKWAVLGDMRELGEDGQKFHKDISKLFAGIDKVILIGEIWKDSTLEAPLPNCVYFDDWQAAYRFISESSDWSIMLLKGSNSHKLQELVVEVEKII